jgi:hypothetical protein
VTAEQAELAVVQLVTAELAELEEQVMPLVTAELAELAVVQTVTAELAELQHQVTAETAEVPMTMMAETQAT